MRPHAFFRMNRLVCLALLCALSVAVSDVFAQSASRVPTPQSVIGHEVGADYKLARWETIVGYFDTLGEASPRVNVRRVGTTTEDNPYLLVEISSEQNMRMLDTYKAMQAKLADPRLLTGDDDRAEVLREARTTIVVTAGLHSSECAGSQMVMELAYNLASRDDARTREILDNCIILLVPSANPDGNNKIVDWYESHVGTPFEGGPMPWLYQKYAGHDNNRDWFMLNLKETRILTKVLYREWHPSILYDVHQMGNRGARFFVPPFFDPVNPNVDPLIHQSLLIIGGHMATGLQEQGKTGVIFKAIFDNYWAGGNRTTPYRHNVVGILTEAASAKMASPIFQDYRELRGGGRGFVQYAPAVNFPDPWAGGWWRLRDIVEYELIACDSLFTLGARYRDRFVRNHLSLSDKSLREGREKPPFAWLIPPDQRDPGAAAHLMKTLALAGVEIQLATEPFSADGINYPPGTHVMLASQPYRSHLKDMMERQDYPERRSYKGGPAESPYDSAGWTLPLQMGVAAVEVVSAFTAQLTPADKLEATRVVPTPTALPAAFVTKRFGDHDYAAINALAPYGFKMSVLTEPHEGFPVGSIVVAAGARVADLILRVQEVTRRLPARFTPISTMPDATKLRAMTPPRTALYQPYTASMDEGWTRFVLETFEFPFTSIHNAEIRAGHLRDRFDCIILPDQRLSSMLDGYSDKTMPPPYAGGIGQDGAMQLERFVRGGGTLVLMDSATQLATQLLRVPVRNVVERAPRDKFFCPGSLLRIRVDNTHPLGYGLPDEVAAFFARSCAFTTGKEALTPTADQGKGSDNSNGNVDGKNKSDSRAAPKPSEADLDAKVKAQPVTTIARYADNIVLLSGWVLGKEWVQNRGAVCEVKMGDGHIVLLGFRVQHRGQPWSTFKFLFNAIYRSTLEE